MISCGEPSGDLYAGALARELRSLSPGIELTGFGGERLRAEGASLVGDISGIAVTGLLEVARVLPRTYATYKRLVAEARANRPDAFVAIDFPDFNFRLARAIRALGIPVVYYISPQLWAWRPGRMATMKRIADRVLVIFPFEERIYQDAGVPVEWVGHPLLDLAVPAEPRAAFLVRHRLDPSKPVVALLPGSRRNEVHEILPGLVAAARIIHTAVPSVQFILARAPHLPDAVLSGAVDAAGPGSSAVARPGAGPGISIVEGATDSVLASSDLALMASGTVTVQAALHRCPMVVVYRLSPLTYRLGRPFVQVDTFAMVNLVAGRKIVPELMQDDFTPERLATAALHLLQNRDEADRMRRDLADVRARLGQPGASRRAARAVMETARGGVKALR